MNGGFENPGPNPFAYAPLGVLPIGKRDVQAKHSLDKKQLLPSSHGNNVVPSSTAPLPYFDLCNFILDISYAGGAAPVQDSFGYVIPFTLPLQTYSISFDTLACGGTDASWEVSINGFLAQGTNFACVEGSVGWQTYTGTFTAIGVLDTIFIRVTGDTSAADNYFDNFVVLPVMNGGPSSTSSIALPVVTEP